ncbi:MAG: AlpA family transcriptional regulator [bacterium]
MMLKTNKINKNDYFKQNNPPVHNTILRLPDVMAITGLSRSTMYLYVQQGLFPKPVKLGVRAVGWPAHEIAEVNAARIAGKSSHEITSLVKQLMINRFD